MARGDRTRFGPRSELVSPITFSFAHRSFLVCFRFFSRWPFFVPRYLADRDVFTFCLRVLALLIQSVGLFFGADRFYLVVKLFGHLVLSPVGWRSRQRYQRSFFAAGSAPRDLHPEPAFHFFFSQLDSWFQLTRRLSATAGI